MESRRDFLKKATLLTGAAMVWSVPDSIQRALAISPDPGTTFMDAEHIVILMQENRSFDHCYGMLRGVRGYNDPRVHAKPDGNPVWVQVTKEGESYAPFRLNMKKTNITWLGGLPHSWENQVGARNDGRYDKWLIEKPAGYQPLADKPMTMGHYTRQDIPFYYALADAFTVCDQNFCSCLTGTTPNRLYLWTGTIRPEKSPDSKPHVYNEEADHDHEVSWPTYPERLDAAGITWKVYQNELDIESGMTGDEDDWLGNFGDNPLEYMTQYGVRFSPRRRAYLQSRAASLPGEIDKLVQSASSDKDRKKAASMKAELASIQKELDDFSPEKWNSLPQLQKDLFQKAFDVNDAYADFRSLETLDFEVNGEAKTGTAPKGDIFYQFRQDVNSGNLPTVSWLVGPEHFSDHPSSAWFGAWYVSETLDILTQNPEVWKKTIFILNYDENDGYFDHIPPFVAPDPTDPEGGKCSEGVDPAVEFVTREQDKKFRPYWSPQNSSIGLGFRVPMVIASPWSRGGCVCSEVFDHTSVIQFLEYFIKHKTGKDVIESNITDWRRTVCGDLTSAFQDAAHDQGHNPQFLKRDEFVEEIYRARYMAPPSEFKVLDAEEVAQIKDSARQSPYMPQQEKGTRTSCPLPYELMADASLSPDGKSLDLQLAASKKAFGVDLHGSPFNAYGYFGGGKFKARAYAVSAGDSIADSWDLAKFDGGQYHVRVDGPNGFMREFKGNTSEPVLGVKATYKYTRRSRDIVFELTNSGSKPVTVQLADKSYGESPVTKKIAAGSKASVVIGTSHGHGWYDIEVTSVDAPGFSYRYAGRIENGEWSTSDPAMA